MGLLFPSKSTVLLPTDAAGLAGAGIAGGRVVPVVLADLRDHPEIAEAIRVHEHVDHGDCVSQWATPAIPTGNVLLSLKFARPVPTSFVVQFDLARYALTVDAIIQARAMYLAHGLEGDAAMSDDLDPILLQIPETGFAPVWERMFHGWVRAGLKRKGVTAKEARRLAPTRVAAHREAMGLQLPAAE